MPLYSPSEVHLTTSTAPSDFLSITQESLDEQLVGSLDINEFGSASTHLRPSQPPVTRREQTIILMCAFLAIFVTIGFNQAYGIFQTYYTSPANDMIPASQARNNALVAFVGTLGSGLTWGGSVFVNPIMACVKDTRRIMFLGALLISLGFGLASMATQTWHLLLTQGLIYGVGSSLLYFPPVSVAPEYFDASRGAAMGFVLSGAGIGGLVLSPLIRLLMTRLGARWTLRCLCLLNLVVSTPVALLARPSRSTTRRPTLVNLTLAKKPIFIFAAIGAFLQAGGNVVPLTFFTNFMSVLGYAGGFGAVLLGINNGINSVSRIAMGFAADRFGRQNTLILSVLGSALSVLALWMRAASEDEKGPWIAFVVFYAILAGGYNALLPTTIAEVFGVQAYASVNAFIYFVRGLGAFFGSPVGGTILGQTLQRLSGNEKEEALASYVKLIWYDGSLLTACFFCVVVVRAFDARDKGRWCWKA